VLLIQTAAANIQTAHGLALRFLAAYPQRSQVVNTGFAGVPEALHAAQVITSSSMLVR
jgi:hypothetical protein